MEIMHSKLVKLQTVLMLLALLFTVLLPSSVHAVDDAPAAQAVTEYEPISDPNTFNAWAKVQANNTSTTGRIWADKTVDTKPITFTEGELAGQKMPMTKGADFQVALSAISSMSSTSSVSSVPLDIVLVLDVSGSMNENFGNVTKIAALKSAVNNFMAEAAAKNKEITVADNKIKISIVKFAGNVNKKLAIATITMVPTALRLSKTLPFAMMTIFLRFKLLSTLCTLMVRLRPIMVCLVRRPHWITQPPVPMQSASSFSLQMVSPPPIVNIALL